MSMAAQDLAFEKGLPANLDAERYVLGSILLDDSVYLQVAAAIQAEDLSLEKHRRIFQRMKDLYDRSETIDRVTVANELMKQGQLESVDGLTYLVSLDRDLPDIANLESYVRIVKDKATLRKLIFTAQRVIELTGLDDGPTEPTSIDNAPEESKSIDNPPEAFTSIDNAPEEWRARFADLLLASTCCWPELEPTDLELTGNVELGDARSDAAPAQPLLPMLFLPLTLLAPLALLATWQLVKGGSSRALRASHGGGSYRTERVWLLSLIPPDAPASAKGSYWAGQAEASPSVPLSTAGHHPLHSGRGGWCEVVHRGHILVIKASSDRTFPSAGRQSRDGSGRGVVRGGARCARLASAP
jgi:hypothetical protein